jgi:hypothetical protein
MSIRTHLLAKFLDRLTPDEQEGYEQLRLALSEPAYKGRRNQSAETFQTVLDLLKEYVGDSRTRALVCGIIWIERGLGINTHQLSIVSNRSKSSINGSMQSLGYGTVPSGADVSPLFEKLFPCLKGDYAQLHQWTIRRRTDEIPPVPPPCKEAILPESRESLLNDVCVTAYLNHECTIAQMVRGLLENRRKLPPAVPAQEGATLPASPWSHVTDADEDRIDVQEGPGN